MCVPLVIAGASLAITAAGAIAQSSAQNKARKESLRSNAQTLKDVTGSANADYQINARILDTRGKQEQTAATQALDANTLNAGQVLQANQLSARQSVLASTRAAAMADGQARVSAGAAGVSGASVDALLSDISRTDSATQVGVGQELATAKGNINTNLVTAQNNIRTNLAMSSEQRALEIEQLAAQRNSRVNGATNLPTAPGANPWSTALQIGGGVVDFARYLQTRKPK